MGCPLAAGLVPTHTPSTVVAAICQCGRTARRSSFISRTRAAIPVTRRGKRGRRRSLNWPCLVSDRSDAGAHPEYPRLAAGYLDLRSVAKLDVQSATHADLDAFDEIEVQDLVTIRAEEAPGVELLFEGGQGAAEER